MLTEVNVEKCEVVAVNYSILQHAFLVDGFWGRIIVRFVFQNLLKKL